MVDYLWIEIKKLLFLLNGEIMKNKNVLKVAILGGTGFAGRNVRNELEKAGMKIEIFSRTTGCDLFDLSSSWEKIDHFRPNYIVNCAALVGSINYVSDYAADVVDHNMRIIMNLYKIAQQMREVIIINPIANCAYPGVMDVYEEQGFWDGPIHPSVLSYGSVRRMTWVFSKCYNEQYGVRSVNLIVPNMYGPYDATNPNKTHALNALIIKFVKAVKYHKNEIEIWGTGKPIREWLYVKDFASIIKLVIKGGEESLDLVNIAQNKGYSVIELVEELKKATGYKGKLTYNTKYQDGSPKKVMDDKYFKQRFPDFSFTSLNQGIKETVEYYKEIL
jgi:GDP-L-fucose synthase